MRKIIIIITLLAALAVPSTVSPPPLDLFYVDLNPDHDPEFQRLLDVIAGRVEVLPRKVRKIPRWNRINRRFER